MKKFFTISFGTQNLISVNQHDGGEYDDAGDFIQYLTFLYKYCKVSRIIATFSKYIFILAFKFKNCESKNKKEKNMFNNICHYSYELIYSITLDIFDMIIKSKGEWEAKKKYYNNIPDGIPDVTTSLYFLTYSKK